MRSTTSDWRAFQSGAHLAGQIDSSVIAASMLEPLSDDKTRRAAEDLDQLSSVDADAIRAAERRLMNLGSNATSFLSAHRDDPGSTRQAIIARSLENAWRELAIEHYERAFSLAYSIDRNHTELPEEFVGDLVSYEAAQSYIELVELRGPRNEAERKRVGDMRQGLATLRTIPTWITPLLVPDASDATLASLFDGSSACFDLGGIGVEQRWPWPRESASFLVWDPDCSGSITSGRQLFGSATWWMFFENGYAALDALDADGDGWLSGAELEGLALWRDVDRDGVSDPGEVESLDARGVRALASRADGLDGIAPMRSNGVVFADGRALPTFDWIASPVPGS